MIKKLIDFRQGSMTDNIPTGFKYDSQPNEISIPQIDIYDVQLGGGI